jgi:hypothetical protein
MFTSRAEAFKPFPVANMKGGANINQPAKMTILERYKTLPDSHRVSDEVEDAHEAEDTVCRRVKSYFKAREDMERKLLTDWTPEEVKASGLTTPRNPRQILTDLEAKMTEHLSTDLAGSRELVYLFRELECTISPLLRSLPEPEPAA